MGGHVRRPSPLRKTFANFMLFWKNWKRKSWIATVEHINHGAASLWLSENGGPHCNISCHVTCAQLILNKYQPESKLLTVCTVIK